MNRLLLPALALLSAATPLVVDSALKGAALMSAAFLGALLLWRASAAARHLVWLVAVLALLAVPLLSLVLPGWRVLPAWAVASAVAAPAAEKDLSDGSHRTNHPSPAAPQDAPSLAANLEPSIEPPAPALPAAVPSLAAAPVALPQAVPWWRTALPFLWSAGCAVLLLRLFGAHWLLRRAARRAQAVTDGPLAAALAAVASQLGVMQRVRLLVEEKRTIPLVWGVWRPRLMLPAEALTWDSEQLQSVLLHELAHIRRRDTLVQWLTQLACALHWFNPLVWLAAWRLHVERERACDDMVLASGVKASTYAEHLLHIASQLSPARWTSACGLAMARKSALEGRLLAVLSEKLNRRGVTSALAAIALILGAGIAIPVAMLRAAEEKWNSPSGAHIFSNDFSTFCIHDGKDASFVIAYQGDFDSSSRSSSNAKARTWNNDVTLTAKKPGITLSFLRTHVAPGKLSITTAPAEASDLSQPTPEPRNFGQKEYDLAKGRVFLLTDSGLVRQLDLPTPIVTDQESSKKLAALIAAIPPQQWESDTPMKTTGKLAPETITKLKWGEPVNGLRMALAWPPSFDDEMLGKKPHFELVVQNVSEKEIHLKAGDEAPNPRKMFIRNGDRIELALSDGGVLAVDCRLQPGHCRVLRLFANEERDKAKAIPSSAIESDLSKLGLFHAIVKMEIAKAPEGAWTGELVTGPTRGSADMAAAPAPKHKDARALYEIWQRHARLSGDIPGALIGELAAAVKVFIGYNPTWETVPKLNEILPRLDSTHDWKPADAIALLDEVAAVQDSPLQTAAEKVTAATISQGKALPEKFANVAWGDTQPNGLRAAWVLEPGAVEHRMGTALKARLLVQNTGKLPVMGRVPTWHQGGVSARDATDTEIEVSGIEWTTMARLVPVRLAPGEFIEISAPGVGLGKEAGRGPWAGPRVGSNVVAKDGTELTLTHGPLALDGSGVGMREDAPHLIGPGWWQAHIKARLARELPLPATGAKRTHLLDRAVRELFATTPTADEIDAFATDQTDSAFDALVQRLAARADVVEFAGSLPAASLKFRVLPADPAADKTPRVVLGPGEYPLSGGTATSGAVTLKIVGRPVGDRRTNEAGLLFVDTEATGRRPLDPHKLEVPDGWGTWAIVCHPGEGFFYLLHKGDVRKIDYSAPRKVTDTPADDLPAEFRDEVKRQFDIHEISAESQAEVFEKPAPPAGSPAPTPRIRGKVLKSDGSPAVGVDVRVDDGIERWKFRGPAFPDLPRPVKTADDGTFSIDVPKGAVAENYEVFASSDDFAPLNARVPTGGNVGMMQFEKGSRVTGRVIGLDGGGLAKVGIWCKRLDWRGRGPAPMKLTSTGADGTFSIPPISLGRHVLQIITRDLGAKELAVAFANQVIEAKDDAPVELEIRPLPTVDIALNARVIRANAEFRDFEVRVSGTLPGTKPGDPAAYWTRQETTKLAEGKHTIAVPAGLQNTSIRADGIYMRKGDAPVFVWQRGRDAQPTTTSILELGILDKPQTISVTVRDAQQEEMLEKPTPPATTPEPKSAEVPEKTEGNIIKVPDDQYVKSGLPMAEVKDVVWNDPQNGLSLGYRIIGDEWRILGRPVEVELWVRNSGDNDVKFQHEARRDIGLRMNMKGDKGEVHEASIVRDSDRPAASHLLLPPDHAFKVKEAVIVSLLWRGNDVSGIGGHYFLTAPGTYEFQCELDLPGFSSTGEGGKQFTPAEGEWTGKLTTRALNVTVVAPDAPAPKSAEAGPGADDAALQPKHESAQKLLKSWQRYARSDGKIPGGLIAALADVVDWTLWTDGWLTPQDADQAARLAALEFTHMRLKVTGPQAAPYLAKLTALRSRIDGSRDRTPAEAIAMLDELTAITTEPVHLARRSFEFDESRKISPGKPLPKELESAAAWGKPAKNGLRAAWLLEPVPSIMIVSTGGGPKETSQYHHGSVLKARVLFHNAGKAPVVFQTETWHQHDGHKALDAKGTEIPVKATRFTGITPLATFRLAPGEYCEVSGHGIAIGAGEYKDEHSTGAIGAVIEAKEGDAVTLTHTVDAAHGNESKKTTELRKQIIAERVNREAPMPHAAADRELLIRRVTLDLTGVAPTTEEVTAFTADEAPDALAKLIARLQATAAEVPWNGKLPTGETKFRVISADPNAAKAPRTATDPGRYVLGDGVHLQVRQVTEGDKRTNSAEIIFFSPDPKKESPHKPYQIGFYVPDSAYAFVWERGANTLWVTEISEGEPIRPWLLGSPERPGPQKVTVRAFDFSNPADVKLTHVSCSENGGDWSWGKIVPVAFHQPVLNALGERGNRLRDFLPAGESRKLDRAMLQGTWEGEKDGATVKVEFQWLSEHQQVRWEVKRPNSSIAAQMSVVITPDGNSTEFIFRKGLEFEATQGRLTVGEGGTLNLEIMPNPNLSDPGYPALKGLILKPKPAAAVGPDVQTALPANGNIVSAEPGGVSIVTSASYKTDTYPLAEGLSIVVRSELYHGADTSTDVVAHWAATENRAATHAVFQVASDTMGNRQPWAVLWENGVPALWLATGKSYMMSGKPAGKTQPLAQLVRIDLSDPENLVSHEFSGIPDAGGPSAAVLEKLRARMTWDGTGTETTRTLRWAQPSAKPGKTAGILHVFTRDAGKFQVSNGKPCDLDGLRESIAEEGKDFVGAPHQFTLVGPPSHWEGMQKAAERLRGWHPTITGGVEATPVGTDQKVAKEADARPRRKIDWSKGPSWNGLSQTFDPAKALALAEAVKKSESDIDDNRRRLMFMILKATAERAPELRPLLEDKELRDKDDDFQSFALALSAYDFAVNGNKKRLQFILDTLASGPAGDVQAAVPLGFIDEWDLSVTAHEKHFDQGSDGAAGEARMMFWKERKFFFPEGFSQFQKAALAATKLDAESLNGTWKGAKDGVTVELRLGKEQRWEVRHGDKLLKAELISSPAETGKFIILIEPSEKGRQAPRGKLSRGEDGQLHLEVWPQSGANRPYRQVNDLVLTKEADTPKGADAGQHRKVDWSKFPHYEAPEIPFANPFVPTDALRLAAVPNKSKEEVKRLVDMIHQATAEKTMELGPLLADGKLKASDDKDGQIGFALAAYDYAVNGNKAGLQRLLDAMALNDMRKAETAAWSLVYVEEWDMTLAAWLKDFGRFANAEEHDLFWNIRKFLYPEKYAQFEAKRLAEANMDEASLRGVWKGKKDGVSVEIKFGEETEWEIRKGDIVSKEVLTTHRDFTTPQVHLHPPEKSKSWISYGVIKVGDAGNLVLQMSTRTGEQIGIVPLTKQPGTAVAVNLTPTAASEYVTVTLAKDGALSYERRAVTLAELKTTAAENAKKWFTIRADEEVPYARAVEVLDTLRAAGVAEITFSEGRMGDGRYRVANRTGNYQFDDAHKFSICMPRGQQQWFTVIWPAKDGRPARRLRFYPELSAEGRTPWAVVWEPGANELWWVDASYVGRMTLADPGAVIVTREGRMAASSLGLTLPEEVRTQFRRLGIVVGQIGQTGPDTSAPVSSQETLVAEVLKADGTAVDHPQVRPGGEWSEAWRELSATVAAARGTPEADLESLIAWGDTKDGLRSGVLMTERVKHGGRTEARLVVRNVSDKSMTVNLSPVPNRIDVEAKAADGTRLQVHKVVLFGTDPSFSYTFKPGQQLEFAAPPIQFGVERNAGGKVQTPDFPVCGVETGPDTVSVRYSLANVHAPDSGDVKVAIE